MFKAYIIALVKQLNKNVNILFEVSQAYTYDF